MNPPDTMTQGCTPAASPAIAAMSMAEAPGDNRLVVIMLRGGMDGLSVVQPQGDPHFAALRGQLAHDEGRAATDLDGFFALHPALSPLMGLWRDGQLGFAHAVSTPYRDKRSHFEGQDLLEAGTVELASGSQRDGWLNRMLQHFGTLRGDTAFCIGRTAMPMLSGAAAISQWAPSADLVLPADTLKRAGLLMRGHPLFATAFDGALHLSHGCEAGEMGLAEVQAALHEQVMRSRDGQAIARFAAHRLREETRIAAFSIAGWDTHADQSRVLSRMLGELADSILTLRDELGPVWQNTTVLALTEFGRTVSGNGTGGTDHGTGGAMIMAGGALRGGRVVTRWPGLSEPDLLDRRDLSPTRDVREIVAWVMRGLYGFDKTTLETTIFPGLRMGTDPGLLA